MRVEKRFFLILYHNFVLLSSGEESINQRKTAYGEVLIMGKTSGDLDKSINLEKLPYGSRKGENES